MIQGTVFETGMLIKIPQLEPSSKISDHIKSVSKGVNRMRSMVKSLSMTNVASISSDWFQKFLLIFDRKVPSYILHFLVMSLLIL